MPRGLLIQPNGDYEFREINVGLGSNDIRDAVGGNFDWADTTDCSMYCYEYALFELPQNPLASVIYWEDAYRNGREPMRTTKGTAMPLAGPTLILGPVDGDMETDVPDWVVQTLEDTKKGVMDQDYIDRAAVILDPSEIPGPQFVPEPNRAHVAGFTNPAWKDATEVPWEGSRRTGHLKF